MSYSIHRYALHARESPASALHTSWYHSIRAPFPLTAHYDHPLVYLLANFLPTYAPAMLFRFHLLTYLLYLALVSIEETFAYSGYTFMPTSFFLGGIARRVDVHALSGAEGNFGPWGVLDWLLGTAVDDGADDEEDEQSAYEREIDEQVRRAIEASRRRVQRRETRRRRRRVEALSE